MNKKSPAWKEKKDWYDVGSLMGQIRSVKYFQWILIQYTLTWYQNTHLSSISKLTQIHTSYILPLAMHGKCIIMMVYSMWVYNYKET